MAKDRVTVGSGNVFADLGLEEASELLVRADLVHRLANLIKVRKLTQTNASKMLGIAQPDLSSLLNGKLNKYGLEKVLEFVREMGTNISIQLETNDNYKPGKISVNYVNSCSLPEKEYEIIPENILNNTKRLITLENTKSNVIAFKLRDPSYFMLNRARGVLHG